MKQTRPPDSPQPGEHTPLDCLLVCALSLERRALLRLIRNPRYRPLSSGHYWEGSWSDGATVGLLQGGIGPDSMRQALSAWPQASRPRQLLVAGLSGGLHPEFPVGQVCRVEQLLCESPGAEPLTCRPLEHSAHWCSALVSVTQLSVSSALLSAADKLQRRQEYGADLVDMESYTVAHISRDWNIPVTVLRAISDPADQTLPAAVLQFARPDGQLEWSSPLRYLLRHPQQLPTLLALSRQSQLALRNLVEQLHLFRPSNSTPNA